MSVWGKGKLLCLVLLASALWAPSLKAAGNVISCSSPTATPAPIRNEGHTEQVGDYFFSCTNTASFSVNATVTVTLSAPVTSIVVNPASGATEASVVNASTLASVQGMLSGDTLTFTVPVPGAVASPLTTPFDITNIRVDATGLASLGQVTETVTVNGTDVNTANFSAAEVAVVFNGISSSVSNITNYGAGATLTASASPFTVQFGEGIPNAFKTKGGSGNTALGSSLSNNTETGYYISTGNGNIANSGTRVRVVLSNIPTGLALYAPISIVTDQMTPPSGPEMPLGTAVATATESGAFSQLSPAGPQPTGYSGTPLAQITVSGGTAEVIYEIMGDSPMTSESYTVPMYLVGPVPSNSGNVTATVSFAPVSAASNVPDFAQLSASTSTLNASQFSLNLTSYTPPAGENGVAYTSTFPVSGGAGPYTFAFLSGSGASLQSAGLSLNAMTGQITGTPTSPVFSSFTLGVTDSTNASTSANYSINIAQTVSINTASLPSGAVNESYNSTLTASFGYTPYAWSLLSGSLPAGLTLNGASGLVNGTPTTANTYNFTIAVTDNFGVTVTRAFSVTINPALAITTTNANIPVGVQGLAYPGAFPMATGGSGGYGYSISSGLAALNSAGLTFTGTSIQGTPNTTGSIQFKITATDQGGGSATTGTLTLTLNPPISFVTTTLPNAEVGVAYSTQLQVTGGSGQYTNWLLYSGAYPNGSPGFTTTATGMITGTPISTAAGSYQFVIRVYDAVYGSVFVLSPTLTLQVNPAPSITTTLLPAGQPGTPYPALTLAATGGSGAGYIYSFSGLPPGVTLTNAGVFGGTPTTPGTYSVQITVTDSIGGTGSTTFTVVIDAVGTVITSNLPLGLTIINLSGTTYGAANSSGTNQSLWSTPITNPGGRPFLEYTIQPGTYTLRAINPTDAASIFPNLTSGQLSTIFTAWTYNSPYSDAYLVFDSSAATNGSQTQIFSGAEPGTSDTGTPPAYSQPVCAGQVSNGLVYSAACEYAANISAGYYNEIHPGPGGRYDTPQFTWSFTNPETLIFAVPDYGLTDNGGGVSILIAPVTSTPSITTSSLPSGMQGISYSAPNMAASGGSGMFQWSATGLPAGITLSAAGVFSGTPTVSGTFASVAITVTDPISGAFATQTFSLTIIAPLMITTASLPGGDLNATYLQTVAATGGIGSYTFSISAGSLPTGLTIGAGNGLISGTLTATGSFTFTVQVLDSASNVATQQFTIAVSPALTITTSTLPNAVQELNYNQTIGVSGGAAPYSFFISSGALPPGLALKASTGAITGVPFNSAAAQGFFVTVTDANNVAQAVSLSIAVNSSPVSYVVLNSSTGGLVRVSADGTTVTAINSSLNGSFDVAQDNSGNFIIAGDSQVERVVPSGAVSTIATAPSGSLWLAVAVDAAGNIIVGDTGQHQIVRISPDGLTITPVANYPVANPANSEDVYVLVDIHGNYILAEDNGGGAHLFSITPSGAVNAITLTGSPLPASVGGLTFDQSGNYILQDYQQQAFYSITPAGVVTQIAAHDNSSFGIAQDPLTGQYVIGDGNAFNTISQTIHNSGFVNIESIVAQTSDFVSSVIATNPLGYFRLEALSASSEVGSSAYTAVGGTTLQTLGAPITTPGNHAIAFDGTSTSQVTTNLSGGITTAASIMAWVNLAVLPSSASAPFLYIAGESQVGNDFDLMFNGANAVGFYTTSVDASPITYTPVQSSLVGQWHMIVATFDANAGKRAIYWDGQRVAADNVVSFTNKTTQFNIGESSVYTGRNFVGQIDEVGVWNYALTPGQVYYLYESAGGIGSSPSITSLGPPAVPANSATTTVAINGTGLQTGSYVQFTSANGVNSTLGPNIPESSTQFTVLVPNTLLTTPGIAQITISNPLGFPTNQLPFTITAAAAPLTLTPTTLPGGVAGVSYGPVTISASGGSGSYMWSATGLPTGITINASTGVISGVTSSTGAFTVNITATDTMTSQSGTLTNVSLMISLAVTGPQPPSLTFTGGTLPTATASQAYNTSVSASGGTLPYTYSASGFPSGIGINPSTGAINGTTTQTGSFTVSIQVHDSASNTASAMFTLTVAAPPPPPPLTLSGAAPQGTAGSPYSAGFSASGGVPPYTYAGSGFPSGIGINANTGAVSGQTTQTGSFTLSVSVTDSTSATASGSFTLSIVPPPALTLSGANLGSVVLGTPVSLVLSASGGVAPYTYAVAGGAQPPGLNLLSGGTLRGTPQKAGPYSFTVKASDASGATASGVFTMTVQPPPLTINLPPTLAPAVISVPYPPQTLSISGGTAPYTFTVSQGTLPAGLTLSSTGMISGTPTGATSGSEAKIVRADASTGNPFTVKAADSSTPPATGTSTFSIAVQPFTQNIVLSAGSLGFSLSTSATNLPPSQTVGVQSTMVSQPVNYTVAVQPASATWLSATSGTTTPGSISVGVTQAALSLAASNTPYTASVVVTCTSGCSGSPQSVAVSLTVSSPPPMLSVQATPLSFNTTSANPQVTTESLVISNTGGGGIGFASITCGAPWCTVSGTPASLLGGASANVTITADPTGLAAGYYYTSISIVSSAGSASVPVTFAIAPNGVMSLSPAGAEFTLPQGGQLTPGSFLVDITGPTPVNFSAGFSSPLLRITNGSGMASGTAPGTVTYTFDNSQISQLAPGTYYGTISVGAGAASNSPQSYEVVINVTPPTTPAVPNPTPGGLLFLSQSGAPLPAQTITVYSFTSASTAFQASASTNSGGNWLSVTPATGNTSFASPGSVSASVNLAGLKPGVYKGAVNFAFSATAVRSVNVTLVVENTGSATTSAIHPDAVGSCKPSQLVPTSTGLVSNFAAPAAWPVPLAITLVDDCGNLITNGQIVATFSNGDPPLILALADPTMASYVATWTPEHSAGQITIDARATAPSFSFATAQIGGAVTPNNAPILADLAIANFYNPIGGAPLAPGALVQITGQYLAGQTMNALSIPLPLTLGGTSVLIGGMQAPVSMVSPGQVNAQVPFELPAGQPYQVIVNANSALTTPQSFQAGVASPGLAVLPSGYVLALHQSGVATVSEASPAKPGEILAVYLVGMGATTIPVASGQPGPGGTFATTVINPMLTLNGEATNVIFSGLIPGLVGVYQVNFYVPSDASNGDLTLSLLENAFASNSGLLPVHN